MLGKHVPYGDVPFFWTRHYNKGLQYVGYAPNYDGVYIDGDVNDKFVAYYHKNNRILAAAGVMRSVDVLTV